MPWSELAKPMISCGIVAILAMIITAGALVWYYRGAMRDMYSEGYRTCYRRYRQDGTETSLLTPVEEFEADYGYTHPEWVSDHTDLQGWTREDLQDEIRKVMAA